MPKVRKTENGVTYEAPSQEDWDRGVRQKVESGSGGSDKSTDTLKREMMGGNSVTGELSAEEKEKRRKVRQEVLARMAAAKG